jgi:hypothetical protein
VDLRLAPPAKARQMNVTSDALRAILRFVQTLSQARKCPRGGSMERWHKVDDSAPKQGPPRFGLFAEMTIRQNLIRSMSDIDTSAPFSPSRPPIFLRRARCSAVIVSGTSVRRRSGQCFIASCLAAAHMQVFIGRTHPTPQLEPTLPPTHLFLKGVCPKKPTSNQRNKNTTCHLLSLNGCTAPFRDGLAPPLGSPTL